MSVEISVCQPEDVAPLLPAARKEGLNIARTAAPTVWFAARKDDAVIGFAKLMTLTARRARFGNLYVVPAERKQGVGTALIAAGIRYAQEHQVSVMDSYTYQPEMFAALGFEIQGEYTSSYGKTYHMRKAL